MLDRGDYWQCAYVIPKGGIEQRARRRASTPFAPAVVEMSPFLADRIGELKSWDDIKLLSVTVDRLRQVVAAGADLHRRRRACDVADRRRRHQYGGAGCGRRRQPARRAAQSRHGDAMRICRRSRSAARCRCASRSGCSSPFRSGSSAACWQSQQRPKPPLLFKLFDDLSRCCAAFRRGCSASASGPSTSIRRMCSAPRRPRDV